MKAACAVGALLALMLLVVAGCGDSEPAAPSIEPEETEAEVATETVAARVERASTAMTEAQQMMMDRLDDRLGTLQNRMTDLKATARAKGPEAFEEYNRLKADWDKQIADVSAKMKELQKAGADNWKELSDQIDQTIKDLQQACAQAAENF